MRGKAHRVLGNAAQRQGWDAGSRLLGMGRLFAIAALFSGLALVTGWAGYFATLGDGWFHLTAIGFVGLWACAAGFTWWELWQVLSGPAGGDKGIRVALILALGPVGALLSHWRNVTDARDEAARDDLS